MMKPINLMKSVPIVKELSNMFPDIEGELCSRHSILFGKLKNTYNKLYDGMDPENYIVVKGMLQLVGKADVELSMALENGVIAMVSRIPNSETIFINSNHFDEELILGSDGNLQEGLCPYADHISAIIHLTNQQIPQKDRSGAIIYLHCNVPEDTFHYQQIFMMAFFLAITTANRTLQTYTIQQLIQVMAHTNLMGTQSSIQKMFTYQNRQFQLHVADQSYLIQLEPKNKLVVCQLDLAKIDINYQRNRSNLLARRRCELLRQCQQQIGMDSIYNIFSSQANLCEKLDFSKDMHYQEEILEGEKQESYHILYRLLSVQLKQLDLLCELNNQNITFEQWVSAQWQLNSCYWKLHSDEVVELITEIKDTFKLNSCMIINESFALIVADKSKYTELLVHLRQKLHKGELKSKSLFKIEEELIQHRWSSDKHIGEKMFTSVPSCGVSIFDPSQAIWFD